MVENSKIKLLWDFEVATVSRVASNRPDLVLCMKEAPEKILLIEISCPADINVLAKETEKITKYQQLEGEMSSTYCRPVEIVPVVFGASGVESERQKSHLG